MPKTLLIVDDEPFIREIVREKIGKHFDQVLEAENGEKAILCLKQQPDTTLIISDFKMPVLDGLQFLEKARELGYQKSFVFFTAMIRPNEVEKMSKLGVKEILVKGETNDWSRVVSSALT